jgi:hypothetical protein
MRSLLSQIWRLPIRALAWLQSVDPYVWLVLLFSLFAVAPLASPDYFFGAHDAPHTVFLLTEFDTALRDGVWYPGWATDQALGYGYPTFVLYPPLAYYAAEGFLLLGLTKVAAIKWTWAIATLGAGLSMYAFARHVMGRPRGFLAAVVYLYVPYHLVDIYVRAALAEYSAFVWMPIALLAFHRLVEEVTARRLALAGISLGALWLTHNPTGLLFTPFLAAYVLFRVLVESGWQKVRASRIGPRRILRAAAAALGAAVLGLGIAAALVLPNLFERGYVNQEQWVRAGYDYALNFVQPAHLLSSSWGYAPGTPGTEGAMSFQLGAVPLILAVVATLTSFRRPTRERALIWAFAVASAVVVFFILPASALVWEALPLVSLVQFPWRLLAITAVTLAILSGFALPHPADSGSKGSRASSLVLALIAVLASAAYTAPQYTPTPASAEGPLLSIEFELTYTDMRGMTAWTREMPDTTPLVEQYLAGQDLVTAEVLAPDASLTMIRAAGASDEVRVTSPQGTALRFYTYYFPGWRVFIDGERLPDTALRAETPYGLITVDVPPGEHTVLLRWGDTPLRLAAKSLTLISLALALLLAVWHPIRQRLTAPRH